VKIHQNECRIRELLLTLSSSCVSFYILSTQSTRFSRS